MDKTCYWNHKVRPEHTYPCFDGENTVCPYCCVEECQAQTPQWFQDCAAAGHPTWPSHQTPFPRKLICLEAAWDDNVFRALSVKGFLESLAPLLTPPLNVAHRYVESAEHLDYYLRQPDGIFWKDPAAVATPVIYLGFHGSPGSIYSPLEEIDSEELCAAFKGYGSHPRLIYFGACSVLAEAQGQAFARKLLRVSQVKALIGYTTAVDWMDSLVVDLLFLYRFYSAADPWSELPTVFESVKRDFPPAQAMGYTLYQTQA